MIYGLNFNGSQIPEHYAQRFAKRKRIDGMTAILNGVAESKAELDLMLVQANNGKRVLRYQSRNVKDTASVVFGVYVCY